MLMLTFARLRILKCLSRMEICWKPLMPAQLTKESITHSSQHLDICWFSFSSLQYNAPQLFYHEQKQWNIPCKSSLWSRSQSFRNVARIFRLVKQTASEYTHTDRVTKRKTKLLLKFLMCFMNGLLSCHASHHIFHVIAMNKWIECMLL